MDGYKSIDITVPIWSNGPGTATVQGIPETRQNETSKVKSAFGKPSALKYVQENKNKLRLMRLRYQT